MSLIHKSKSLAKMMLALLTQPALRTAYLDMTDALYGQAETDQRLLTQWPPVLRGFRYAQAWRPAPVKDTSPSRLGVGSAPQPGRLRSYFDAHKEGRGIWKWNHYFEIYEQYFSRFVGREVHVLEIGIYSGGSLEMWRDYFGPGCRVYGVDIQAACKAYENEYTRIFIGDQGSREFWRTVTRDVPRVDILIDDGGHEPEQQIVTVEEMLPHIAAGGVYLCEDIHGIQHGFASYVYGLVNNLNETQGSATDGVRTTPFQSWIKSIDFYPYVAVLQMAESPTPEFIGPKHGTQWQPFL